MSGGVFGAAALVGFTLLGCTRPTPALYAGWEPLNVSIPSATAEQALQRLQQSRAIWRAWRTQQGDFRFGFPTQQAPGKYSYARAKQVARNRVDFTLFVVEADERVSLRALITVDPKRLSMQTTWLSFESRWVERGADVGKHEDGAAAGSVDALYNRCEVVIREHASLPVRLFFDPGGVLMQCGFAPQGCAGCGEVSLQSYSHFPVDSAMLSEEPAKWVCSAAWGVFLPGTDVPLLHDALSCVATPRAPHVPATMQPHSVCSIDPATCLELWPAGDSHWQASAHCARMPTRAPGPLDLGKAEPRGQWYFESALPAGSDCGE